WVINQRWRCLSAQRALTTAEDRPKPWTRRWQGSELTKRMLVEPTIRTEPMTQRRWPARLGWILNRSSLLGLSQRLWRTKAFPCMNIVFPILRKHLKVAGAKEPRTPVNLLIHLTR